MKQKYSYEEMCEKFPIKYKCRSFGTTAYIEEFFDLTGELSDILRYHNVYLSLEEAKDKMSSNINKLKEEDRDNWQNKVKLFNAKSLIYQFFNNNDKKAFNDLLKKSEKKLSEEPQLEISLLDKDKKYEIFPYLLKEGESIYLTVEHHNELPFGIYEAHLKEIKYNTLESPVSVNYTATGLYVVEDKNNTYEFSFNADENGLHSVHVYHNIYLDKNKALNDYEEDLKQRQEHLKEEESKVQKMKK